MYFQSLFKCWFKTRANTNSMLYFINFISPYLFMKEHFKKCQQG